MDTIYFRSRQSFIEDYKVVDIIINGVGLPQKVAPMSAIFL